MPKHEYIIRNTLLGDLPFIYWMFEQAIAYQKAKNYIVWKGYDKYVLQNDISEGRNYKLITGGDIALVFSVVYTDRVIWGEKEKGDAIYLHRIVVNPKYKGRRLFGKLLQWAADHAMSLGLNYIRMDTWGDNPQMIAYYQEYGFRFVENLTTGDDPDLPSQHRNLFLALLEMAIPR